MALSITLRHETQTIRALREDWIDLQNRSAARGAALTWQWMDVWWMHFSHLGQLWLLEARDDGRLLGIAPLMKVQVQPKYGVGWRQLEFIGTSHRHEHLDFIVERGREGRVIPAFIESLLTQRRHWDVLHLAALSETPATEILKGSPLDWQENFDQRMISPFLKLPGSIDEWMHTVSKNRRKKQRIYYKRLDAAFAGRWSIELVNDPSTLVTVLRRLMELHTAKWQSRKQRGAFHLFGDLTAFYQDLMLRLLQEKWLRLYYIVIDGKIAAILFGYHYRGRAYDQVSGIDETMTTIPLGHVLTQHSLEEAIATGHDEYSFMWGEESYKYSFGATNRTQRAFDLVVNSRVKYQRKIVSIMRRIKASFHQHA